MLISEGIKRKANAMQKYKNALHNTLTKLSQGVAAWYIAEQIPVTTNRIELVILGFGFFWLATDVALWAFNYVVKPSAIAIYKSNR